MKTLLIPGIAMVVLVILLSLVVSKTLSALYNEEQKFKDLIGVEIVYQEDTLMIVDYSLWDATITLSNTLVVSTELAKTLTVIGKKDEKTN